MNDRITEFTYRPIADKRRALPPFFALLTVSAVLVALATFLPSYKGVVSFVAMLFLCATVLIFTRYYIADFFYSVVVSNDGDAHFLVSRVTGQRESLMCTLPLSSIVAVEFKAGDAAKKYKPSPSAKKYNFVPDYKPEAFFVIFASGKEGTSEIMIYGTPELAERLKEYAKTERERKLREGEEE